MKQFKPQDEPLTYQSYLKIDELVSLQQPVSDPPAHDEMLFIIIHQAYELWFKLLIFEMDTIVSYLERDNTLAANRSLERISEVFRVLIQQIDILETMTPMEFNRFRSKINPASGFQSLQFREFEIAGGVDPAEYEKFAKLQPEWGDKLTQRIAKPTLRSAFLRVLKRRRKVHNAEPDSVVDAITQIYQSPELELQTLCESLIRFDEQVSLWRFRHVQMVERMIGMKPGTGGSLGVSYLQATLKKRFFPELWEARTSMGASLY